LLKINYIIIFLVLLGFYDSFSQELIITYEKESIESIDAFKKNLAMETDPMAIRMGNIELKAIMEAQKRSYNLEINKNLSHFYLNKILLSDSNSETLNSLASIIAEKGDFYQNSQSKQIIEITNPYTIAYNFDFFEWILSNETKQILGYTCYKAKTSYLEPHPVENRFLKREITVWYAPELPFNFGPQGYGGLPGLILKKCQSGNCFVASKIKESVKIIDWPQNKSISRDEYFKKVRKQVNNFKY
jgi:GLPGLI family protein